jgi:beta-lactamase superfamily II metal-dependent hydrolase
MSEWLYVDCLDVGQGTGVLASLYSADPDVYAPDHVILMDLGSEQAKQEAGVPAVEYVVQMLKRMKQPTLDAVFLSHSDSDHVNLIADVLAHFDPWVPGVREGRPTLRIRYAMYGGDWDKYKKGNSINVLDWMNSYMIDNIGKDDFMPVQPNYVSSFRADEVGPSRKVGFADLRLLVGNAANTKSGRPTKDSLRAKTAFAINTMSLVVVLNAFDGQFVMTGDATGATMKLATDRLRNAHEFGYVESVFAVTAPHHGSIKSALDVGQVGGDPENVVKDFVRKLDSDSVQVSAGMHQGFKHPSATLLHWFSAPLRPASAPTWALEPGYDDRHFFTAYFEKEQADFEALDDTDGSELDWPADNGWRTVQTNLSLFTSIYSSPAHLQDAAKAWPPSPAKPQTLLKVGGKYLRPPFGVMWQYRVEKTAAGKTYYRMRRRTNRDVELLFETWAEQARLEEAGVAGAVPAVPAVPDPEPAPPDRPALGPAALPVRRPAAPATGLRRLRVLP